MKKVLLIILVCVISSFAQEVKNEFERFEKFFADYNVTGSFVMYDMNKEEYFYHNKKRCEKQFIPASTFKIFNSLAALETGVIKDEYEVFKWDGEKRWVESWNKDQEMKTAFKNSTVWYYQELARRIGYERMKEFIEQEHYGNENISGGIDRFWLDGELRISQVEQINFLKRFYNYELSFSKRSIDIVKSIMLAEETSSYKLYAKTGWADVDKINYGWYVGFIETGNDVYFFATNIEKSEPAGDNFAKARIEITKNILKELEILN
ncbi:MAG: class D beta-lactamase [Ignavibacteriales bacterium]|nr:MAG: class D beta-lactamase [Ignavibacteriales bacterium]